MKKKINSRQKGARVERQAAKFLTKLGFPAERAARCGVDGGDDLICRCLSVAFETKGDRDIDLGTKALSDAMEQAFALGGSMGTRTFCVLWWRHRKGWALSYPEAWGTCTIAGDEAIKAYLERFRA